MREIEITIRKSNGNDKPLSGKSVLITGAARRLGRAAALAMAGAGADVAITFLTSAREAQSTVVDLGGFGVRAIALRCDVTDPKSVANTVREVKREFGGLDILVNNAAKYETVEFEKLTLETMGWHVRRRTCAGRFYVPGKL